MTNQPKPLSERMRHFDAKWDNRDPGWFADEVATLERQLADAQKTSADYAYNLEQFRRESAAMRDILARLCRAYANAVTLGETAELWACARKAAGG